ncbi:protein XAP5 CIRCADIAN TIMEKEEPER isoform X1 [Cinnamomum micranthum f. kanehirae]|uniref:Protein XAP5 CIRCADIAN TIMEKEEPER isoform X1 n=1 Tax=Cinnamomum micranthum f. kanehirae TaxID=337451 RepID=A0A443P5E0_9MAGN|nr:protein XAP5 CIRCADIAN TIMEKEEPER isoform X1 [Cinnamomum micranthum f. kanehirae]|eukprot:TRINITY_DN34437_c0_g1_i5.p1 TRINITY_DN34437_c0_g1~~TRINITY_DN34437_c0_g1_i5.p1  ORF type:complete len:338 (-),score=90.43 TRINITY_DN34437_c0_g1_i5:953-1966(-)
MAGMGDGYVGTAQDAVRIRRLQKQREVEKRKIQELKSKSASAGGQTGLLQFGSGTSEILETAFKKETVGLVTREQYVEKRVNIRNKIEEEEKEKLQKLQQEEEELELQKRKKRRVGKGNSRLSFADDIENESDEEAGESDNQETKKFGHGGLGKDPTVETSFLPDSEREAEEQAERERLRRQWLREQEQIRNEPLEITYSYWDGTGHRRVIQVRKGDAIGEFLRAVQQQLAPEFREIRTTSVENLLYVKEDLIIPHQHSFYELIINKARGKSGPLFHFDVHEDVRTIADATIEKDESHAGKVVERHWYEKNKHIFPASRWEIYDPTKKWERYTIHGD